MPLNSDAEQLIRENLVEASRGNKLYAVTIGRLSDAQLESLNREREKYNLGPLEGTVIFRGKHVYESRIAKDGYSIEDVILQILSAFSNSSVIRFSTKMTALQNPSARKDGYGNSVKDQGVLECTGKFPTAELFSVIPKGDNSKPPAKNKDRLEAVLIET
jgi:hypothetical protein